MAILHIDEELRVFAESQASRQGLADAEAYVAALLVEARQKANGSAGRSTNANEEAAAAIRELDRLRVGTRLNGASIRALIEEGRRF